MNVTVLQGVLSSDPRRRELPSGSILVNWELTTETDGTKQSVPVTWFDPPKSIEAIGAGDEVVVVGSVRRRFYRAHGQTISSTEVVAERGARAGGSAAVRRLLRIAVDRVAEMT